MKPLVSPGTRLDALDPKRTNLPLDVMEATVLAALPCTLLLSTLARSTNGDEAAAPRGIFVPTIIVIRRSESATNLVPLVLI